LTGIPFVGSAIGRAYDYGKGIFGSKPRDMSQFNRLGLFGLPPGTLDEEDKIAQPLTEAELNAYARFGDIGLPNQTNTVENKNRFLGFPITNQGTNVGLTGTNTFRDSPYQQADFTDYMGNYTNMMENNVPVSNDEQMFIDNEIAANRFN
jgi:hypothetical protein